MYNIWLWAEADCSLDRCRKQRIQKSQRLLGIRHRYFGSHIDQRGPERNQTSTGSVVVPVRDRRGPSLRDRCDGDHTADAPIGARNT